MVAAVEDAGFDAAVKEDRRASGAGDKGGAHPQVGGVGVEPREGAGGNGTVSLSPCSQGCWF
jgi:hypothetical protein